MPITNLKYTSFKVVAVPWGLDGRSFSPDSTLGSWTYLLASDVNVDQNMQINAVKLTLGSGQTPIRDIEDIETTYVINGPCLVEDTGFLYDNTTNSLCVPSFAMEILNGVGRKSGYMSNMVLDLNYPNSPPGLYYNREKPVITNIRLSVDEEGLTGGLKISGLHFGPEQGTGTWSTPLRKTKWYDFYINLYLQNNNNIEYIGQYKMNAEINFNINYIEMPYIGKAQYKRYVYNGSTMKWSVKAIYDANLKRPTVTRQDGMYPTLSENYPYFPQYLSYTNPAAEQLIPGQSAKAYSTGIIMRAVANDTIGSDLRQKFESIFNNILWQTGSAFDLMGYEVSTTQLLGDSLNQNAFGFVNKVGINMKFPLSDFTVSGEKVFS